ncbi:hypothetical protein BCEN4_100004 [Burkholderia cenocepacia]|nr:hypothetical protein BCEN4_100004 [Burkholderia cenocepacia]
MPRSGVRARNGDAGGGRLVVSAGAGDRALARGGESGRSGCGGGGARVRSCGHHGDRGRACRLRSAVSVAAEEGGERVALRVCRAGHESGRQGIAPGRPADGWGRERYFAASALATFLSTQALSATLSFCGISFAA